MRQSWARRLVSLLLTPCFALAMWNASGAQDCPMHGGMDHSSGAHGSAGHASMQHNAANRYANGTMPESAVAHSAMTHGTMTHDAAPGDHAPAGKGHSCTCTGSCCGTTGLVLPATPPRLTIATLRQSHAAATRTVVRLAERVEHALPFATAPPRMSA